VVIYQERVWLKMVMWIGLDYLVLRGGLKEKIGLDGIRERRACIFEKGMRQEENDSLLCSGNTNQLRQFWAESSVNRKKLVYTTFVYGVPLSDTIKGL
jgi:hypothetical protein